MDNLFERDGSPIQSSNMRNPHDYNEQRIYVPMIGIVLALYHSDHPRNTGRSGVQGDSVPEKSSRIEASVLIVNDESHSTWIIPNAIVCPPGASGIDDYTEELPRPTTQTADGSFSINFHDVDYSKLDGDRCIVQFIGGMISNPIITNWFPHVENRRDPATAGLDTGNLVQGRRYLKRVQGTTFAVTKTGSVQVNTQEAGSALVPENGRLVRKKREFGGDLNIDMKESRKVEVNFNKFEPSEDEPSLPQPNPPTKAFEDRPDVHTKWYMDKEFINAVAGRIAHIRGNNDGEDHADTVLLGETPTDHVVLGEKWQATFNAFIATFNAFVDEYNAHLHQSGPPSAPTSAPVPGGASGFVPNPAYPTTDPVNQYLPVVGAGGGASHGEEMPDTDLSEVVKVE